LINASRSDAITFSNLTVHASSAMAVLLNWVSHSTVDHVRVMPRPGAGLIASSADGIHFVLSGPDNHIRNSFVTRTLDDALSIDSLDLATVTSQSGPRQIIVQRSLYRRFPGGTTVNFVDPATAGKVAGATIVSRDPPDSNSQTLDGSVELTFDQDLPMIAPGFGLAFAHASDRGAGSSIEGSEAQEISFGRGVYIAGAKEVKVEHNKIAYTSNGGIAVSQNVTAYPSPPSDDITIQFNEIDGSLGPMASGSSTQIATGAVLVSSTTQTNVYPPAMPSGPSRAEKALPSRGRLAAQSRRRHQELRHRVRNHAQTRASRRRTSEMGGLLAAGTDAYRLTAPCLPHVPSQLRQPKPVCCSEAGPLS